MDLQAQKDIIIEQFKQVNDVDLVNAIKELLDSAIKKRGKEYSIPPEHQNLVMERFDKAQKDPETLLDWDDAKNKLKS